jgi:UDP-2,3-diacylglucosamine hydrolase
MLALIAGTGGLPAALVARLPVRPVVCAMDGFAPELVVDVPFRIEHLGSFIDALIARGVTEVCFAGAVKRPAIDPSAIDAATAPLVPRIMQAIVQGDDGALRIVIALFEERGLNVRTAHEIAPDLLPAVGVLTFERPNEADEADAEVGEDCITEMGAADVGQACVVLDGDILAREDITGTEAMLTAADLTGGILFKAPKLDQDRRADLPLIGVDTARQAADAGLLGIVIEAGGVMVLDLEAVIAELDEHGMFLWVRDAA